MCGDRWNPLRRQLHAAIFVEFRSDLLCRGRSLLWLRSSCQHWLLGYMRRNHYRAICCVRCADRRSQAISVLFRGALWALLVLQAPGQRVVSGRVPGLARCSALRVNSIWRARNRRRNIRAPRCGVRARCRLSGQRLCARPHLGRKCRPGLDPGAGLSGIPPSRDRPRSNPPGANARRADLCGSRRLRRVVAGEISV